MPLNVEAYFIVLLPGFALFNHSFLSFLVIYYLVMWLKYKQQYLSILFQWKFFLMTEFT